MDIDKSTGLPALEDGYRWEVEKIENKYLRVNLTKRGEEAIKVEKTREVKGFWKTRTETYTALETVEVWDAVMGKSLCETAHSYEREGYRAEDGWEYSGCSVSGRMMYFIRVIEPTKENVLAAAIKVKSRYDKRMAEAAAEAHKQKVMDDLAGIYPPKTLGSVEK